jgi:hypothetical protein
VVARPVDGREDVLLAEAEDVGLVDLTDIDGFCSFSPPWSASLPSKQGEKGCTPSYSISYNTTDPSSIHGRNNLLIPRLGALSKRKNRSTPSNRCHVSHSGRYSSSCVATAHIATVAFEEGVVREKEAIDETRGRASVSLGKDREAAREEVEDVLRVLQPLKRSGLREEEVSERDKVGSLMGNEQRGTGQASVEEVQYCCCSDHGQRYCSSRVGHRSELNEAE